MTLGSAPALPRISHLDLGAVPEVGDNSPERSNDDSVIVTPRDTPGASPRAQNLEAPGRARIREITPSVESASVYQVESKQPPPSKEEEKEAHGPTQPPVQSAWVTANTTRSAALGGGTTTLGGGGTTTLGTDTMRTTDHSPDIPLSQALSGPQESLGLSITVTGPNIVTPVGHPHPNPAGEQWEDEESQMSMLDLLHNKTSSEDHGHVPHGGRQPEA